MSLVFKTPQSTLNTTTGLGQNIGSGCPECPECPEVDLTTGSAEYTENGEYTLTPEGDGFSSVDVTVNVDVTTPYNNGVAAGEAAQKAKLESATFVSNGTYTKEDGYNSVTVNVPSDINNQEKNATPTTSSQEIVADNGYSGLSKVTISGVTSAIDSNITAGNIKKDVAILGVTGTYDPQPTLQDKTVAPTTSQQVISADNGYDGLDEVTVGAVTSAIDQNIVAGNIKSGVTILGVQGTVQEGITPTGNINITDTSSTNVTNYATAQVVDANLAAANIKNGVSILGVSGTYDPQPDTYIGEFTADQVGSFTLSPDPNDGDYFSGVTIDVELAPRGSLDHPFDDPVEVIDEEYTECYYFNEIIAGEIDEQTGYYVAEDDAGDVFNIKPMILNPDYDENEEEDPDTNPHYIFPDNFDLVGRWATILINKSNVTDDGESFEVSECVLAMVDYNAEPQTWPFGTLSITQNGTGISVIGYEDVDVAVQPTLQTKTATPTTSSQTITPDNNYDGLSQVTVNAVTSAIDNNITAGNIKDGVSILGVTGTYTGSAGTNCPDWSSIGWNCSDVNYVGIISDVAYTENLLTNYDDTDHSNTNLNYWTSKDNLVYAPKINVWQNGSRGDLSILGFFQNNPNLEYVPDLTFVGITTNGQYSPPNCNSMFQWDRSLKRINLDLSCADPQSNGYVVGANNMFNGCKSLQSITLTNTAGITNCSQMFNGCSSLHNAPLFDTSNVTTMAAMFSGCEQLRTLPLYNTSNVTEMTMFVSGCSYLENFPQFDTSKVEFFTNMFGSGYTNYNYIQSFPLLDCSSARSVNTMFNTYGSYNALTTLGGFTNLGKAFLSSDTAAYHRLDLKKLTNLTKQSIMNVINNLAAPDDTNVADATLNLSAASYALLDVADLAIATAKNWAVTSS